jgi:hypothetical protein
LLSKKQIGKNPSESKKENNMNDKEFMDKIRELVETIKFYETTETLGQNEIKSLLKHYRSELENLLFGNI